MKKVFIILAAFSVAIAGCSKKKGCTDPISIKYDADAEEDDGSCTYGGSGGSASIKAFPEHHDVPILSSSTYPDSAFVKFNAKDSPGLNPSAYDLIVVGVDGDNFVTIPGLKAGWYWVQMTGYDTAISQRVIGGGSVKVSTDNEQVSKKIAVTED